MQLAKVWAVSGGGGGGQEAGPTVRRRTFPSGLVGGAPDAARE